MHTNFRTFDPNDFSKTVLSWDFEILSRPLLIAIQQAPLPKIEQNVGKYYANFLPLILEEARAIIASGLEQVDQYIEQSSKRNQKDRSLSYLSDAKPFNLTLKKQARLPRTEGNPMSMTFRGAIPDKIEHGSSMNVLLLKTKGIDPEKKFIALATENQGSSELFVKIIIASADYYDYEKCFADGWQWQAHYLGSVISEQRMYDTCLEATDCSCVQQIARAQIQKPLTTRISSGSLDADRLNLSQKEAIYAFLNAREGSTLLLQGPPGTGKTTTLVTLLKEVAHQGKRTMVSAHSNKGVQVLALRAVDDMTDTPMILVGVESKVPEKLKAMFLNRWHEMIMSFLFFRHEDIKLLVEDFSEPRFPKNKLISEIDENIYSAQKVLGKFTLIDSRQLSGAHKKELFELSDDPILMSDFQGFQSHINQLKSQPDSKRLWSELLTILNRLVDKWKKINKEKLEKYLLDHASIIFSTLISAGRRNMLTMSPVDFLLVDEAAQSVEAATLIPMRFKPNKILLVGDTNQLPATVISKVLDDSSKSRSTHYKWSMMWRLIEENNQPHLMLDIQYRMHPQICQWPSGQYYDDRLITSPKILPMPLLDNTGIMSRPYAIYQILGQAESRDGSYSISNIQEADYVIKIIEHIRQKNKLKSVGVITPYAAQKRLISDHLSKKSHLQNLVDVNTVDGFQGDERDIIIISFTRTHVSEFLKEFRRLNVAITRAKDCLIILGAPSLLSNDIGDLMGDARRRKVLFSEQDLKNILRTGSVLVAQQNASTVTDPLALAYQGNASDQLNYAKGVSDKRKAILWYRRAAENNDAEAQSYIGQVYLLGNEIVRKDIQLGIAWLTKSSHQNFPIAQYVLGKYCILGIIVVKDVSLGITLCERAVSGNLVDAMVFLANLYDDGREVSRHAKYAENYYRQAAKLDHLTSMEKLAALLSGGTLDNQREALKWYQKVAARQITTAYYPLAHLLNTVFNNQTEAFEWYLKAAEHGHREAQYELGLRFKDGLHECAVDILRSTHFFKLAAIAGHMQAQFIYATSLKEEGNHVEAMRFFQLAADQGHCESQYQFALLIAKSDRHKAYPYHMKAAQQNHSLAKYECVEYQIKFNRDLKTCLDFCERLAAQGNPQAQFLSGRILDTGLVGKIDKKQAYQYYSLLAQDENPLAQYYCAILLERGEGVEQDLLTSRRYYESSLEQCFGARLRLACLLLREINDSIQELQFFYSEQNQTNTQAKTSTQDQERVMLYQKPLELLEHYFKHCPERQPLKNTIEHHLEYLVLESPVKKAAYAIGVVNTHSAQANYLLGKIFQEGMGVSVDVERALKHYQLASTQHPDASYCAGYIYESGLCIARDGSAAKKYYSYAAEKGHELASKRLTWSYWLSTRKTVPDDETLRKTKSNNCSMM